MARRMPEYTVCAVKGTGLTGDGPRMCIQQGLFEAFAELYGGTFREGRAMQMLRIRCPEGDAEAARSAVLSRVDIYTVNGASSAAAMRDALVARALEKDMEGMGIAALTHVLDRLGSRYDMFKEDE